VVVGPLLTVAIVATLDFMHDYARMHLVLRGYRIWDAFSAGCNWPFRHFSAVFIYKFWFVTATLLWLVPFWLDGAVQETVMVAILGTFLLQQLTIVTRQAVMVGWIGSQVSFFELNSEDLDQMDEDSDIEPDVADHVQQIDTSPPTSGE
jgi:hypothetical protein